MERNYMDFKIVKSKSSFKKKLCGILVVVMFFTCVQPCLNTFAAFSGNNVTNGNVTGGNVTGNYLSFRLNSSKKYYYVSSCSESAKGDIVIPAKYKGKRVTYIATEAFRSCGDITTITIPSTVKKIGNNVFDYCESLKAINVAENNANYESDDGVLFSKDKTTLIQYPINKSGAKYVIPDGVTSIGPYAFEHCNIIKSIAIPDSVTAIGRRAFGWCRNLTSVYITNLAAWCNVDFSGSDSYPLNWHGGNLYINGEIVENVIIPDGVKKIPAYCFYGCESLVSVTFPDSVTAIGYEAFSGTGLTSIEISANVEDIGIRAFEGCSNLCSVNVDRNNPYYISENDVLYDKDKTKLILYPDGKKDSEYIMPDSVTQIESGSFTNKYVSSVVISNNVSHISLSTFDACKNLSALTIPVSVKEIYCFDECCYGLEYIFYLGSESDWDAISIYDEGSGCLNRTKIHYNSTGHTMVDGVCQICGFDSFINEMYQYLTFEDETEESCNVIACSKEASGKIIIPSTYRNKKVTSINEYAFKDCTKITSIVIPDSITYVGFSAFESCTNLTSVELGNNIKRIRRAAFSFCTNLTSVKIPDSVTELGRSAFESCTNLASVEIGSGVTTIESETFSNCTSLTYIKIPETVNEIEREVFYGCVNLKSIMVPASVTDIWYGAFDGFDGTIYCVKDSEIHKFAVEYNLKYVLIDDVLEQLIQGTANTQIDYDNFVIYTSVQNADDISEILGVSESAVISVKASYVCGDLELYGTGTVITVFDGNNYIGDFTLVVEGDTNGDSVCDVIDCAQVARASSEFETLEGAYAMAADSNMDDIIDATDYQSIVNLAIS